MTEEKELLDKLKNEAMIKPVSSKKRQPAINHNVLMDLARLEGSSSVKGRLESIRNRLKELKVDGPKEGVISLNELTKFLVGFIDEILEERGNNVRVATEFDKADRSAFTNRL